MTKKDEKLNLSEEQNRVAEALVFSGVNYERSRLIGLLEPHRGKAISVDVMINIINNIPIQSEEQEESD